MVNEKENSDAKKNLTNSNQNLEITCPHCHGGISIRSGEVYIKNDETVRDHSSEKSLVEWEERFNIGIDVVDKQHQRIVELINKINRSVRSLNRPPGLLKEICVELTDYVVHHFDCEERLFMETDYPNKEQHKKMHRRFIKSIKDFFADFDERVIVLRPILSFLVEWLLEHILGTDQNLVPYLKKLEDEKKK